MVLCVITANIESVDHQELSNDNREQCHWLDMLEDRSLFITEGNHGGNLGSVHNL